MESKKNTSRKDAKRAKFGEIFLSLRSWWNQGIHARSGGPARIAICPTNARARSYVEHRAAHAVVADLDLTA